MDDGALTSALDYLGVLSGWGAEYATPKYTTLAY